MSHVSCMKPFYCCFFQLFLNFMKPHLLELFRIILQCCLAVTQQKCFVDYLIYLTFHRHEVGLIMTELKFFAGLLFLSSYKELSFFFDSGASCV